MANSSRVKTSGYWVFSKACSNWCSWKVVKVVRDRRIFRVAGCFPSSKWLTVSFNEVGVASLPAFVIIWSSWLMASGTVSSTVVEAEKRFIVEQRGFTRASESVRSLSDGNYFISSSLIRLFSSAATTLSLSLRKLFNYPNYPPKLFLYVLGDWYWSNHVAPRPERVWVASKIAYPE